MDQAGAAIEGRPPMLSGRSLEAAKETGRARNLAQHGHDPFDMDRAGHTAQAAHDLASVPANGLRAFIKRVDPAPEGERQAVRKRSAALRHGGGQPQGCCIRQMEGMQAPAIGAAFAASCGRSAPAACPAIVQG